MLDPDGDGIYETTVVFNEEKKKRPGSILAVIPQYQRVPQYHSPSPIADAIYNLSLEEMEKAIEPDSTFRTGKEWAGVWTRGYQLQHNALHGLSAAKGGYVQPYEKGQERKDHPGYGNRRRISLFYRPHDLGNGSLADIPGYRRSGLAQNSYAIIKRSVEDDRHNAFDKLTGLVKGESSFLDWREQTYPKWMQPADIYESFNLGTNAVHFRHRVLSLMAKNYDFHRMPPFTRPRRIRSNRPSTFIYGYPEKDITGNTFYSRTSKILSPRSEALGEALCVLFGIAGHERAKSVIEKRLNCHSGYPVSIHRSITSPVS